MTAVDIAALVAAIRRAIRARQEQDSHYSVRQFAEDAGIKHTTLADILSGATKNPRAATVGKLLAHLNNRLLVYRTMYPRADEDDDAQRGASSLPEDIVEMYRQDPEKMAKLTQLWGKLSPRRQTRALAYLRGMGDADTED